MEPGFYLRNAGIGPAAIRVIDMRYKGRPLRNPSELRQLLETEWLISRSDKQPRIWHTWAVLFDAWIESAILPAGEKMYILKLRNESWEDNFVPVLERLLPDIEIRVMWESIYGKRFKIPWTALSCPP
jgi:hypothetical protein